MCNCEISSRDASPVFFSRSSTTIRGRSPGGRTPPPPPLAKVAKYRKQARVNGQAWKGRARNEMARFMMERAQFILDGPISCLKGFIPGLRGPNLCSPLSSLSGRLRRDVTQAARFLYPIQYNAILLKVTKV